MFVCSADELHSMFGRALVKAFEACPSVRSSIVEQTSLVDGCSVGKERMPWKTGHGACVWVGENPALVVGFEMKAYLEIHQMHCIFEDELPPDLHDWPERFIAAAKDFAEAGRFVGVSFFRGIEEIREEEAITLARLPDGLG